MEWFWGNLSCEGVRFGDAGINQGLFGDNILGFWGEVFACGVADDDGGVGGLPSKPVEKTVDG